MPKLVIHNEKVTAAAAQQLMTLCPFNALEYDTGGLRVNAGCKMCRLCVKNGPEGLVEWVEDEAPAEPDLSGWHGVAVYAEQHNGTLAPVVAELLGKAAQLARVAGQPVVAVLIGHRVQPAARQLLAYGAQKVYLYDAPCFEHFGVLSYAGAFEDFIKKAKPSSVLVGATNLGRSLAPRVAARFGSGLTADCTRLEMRPDASLIQIRPAFGGNIMAQIVTPRHRPQFCTVRYKVFSAPARSAPAGEIVPMQAPRVQNPVQVLQTTRRPAEMDISDADAIVAVGRGVKSEKDLALAKRLAGLLGAQLACTRPLIENGWFGPKKQIGLSGRTVAPKIIVTLGVSGSVQFVAGMQNAGCIMAINSDAQAPIFSVAHYALVGDLYAILPQMLEKIEQGKGQVS